MKKIMPTIISMGCLDNYYYLKLILDITLCSISFMLSFIVIVIIMRQGLFKSYSFKILLYISLIDILRSFMGFFEFQVYQNSFLCSLYSYLDIYFFLSNMMWAFCLTFTIYQIIVQEATSFEKYEKIWFFNSFIMVAIIEALPFTTQSYGYNQGICQLDSNEIGEIWRFSLIYFPMLLILIIITILFHKIMKKVEILGNISMKNMIFDRGLIYTLIVAIAVIPFFIIRTIQIFDNGCLTQSLAMFMNFFVNFQGTLNGIAFFYSKASRSAIFRSHHRFNASIQSNSSSLHISFASDIIIS